MVSKNKSTIAFTIVLTLLVTLILASAVSVFAGVEEKPKSSGTFLGVYPSDLDDLDREALDLKGKDGVLINDIVDDGPAQKAGLKSGDVLIGIGKKDIESMKDMRKVLAKLTPGETANITVIRDGEIKKMDLILGEKPLNTLYPNTELKPYGFLGVVTISIEDQLAEYFGVKEGALIEQVSSETPAKKAGLKAGDVIIKIDDDEIEDRSSLQKAMRSCKPEQEVVVTLKRRGEELQIPVVLGKAKSPVKIFNIDENIHFDFDFDDVGEAVKDALKHIEIQKFDIENQQEFREELNNLREELQKLKQEIREEKKKQEQKN